MSPPHLWPRASLEVSLMLRSSAGRRVRWGRGVTSLQTLVPDGLESHGTLLKLTAEGQGSLEDTSPAAKTPRSFPCPLRPSYSPRGGRMLAPSWGLSALCQFEGPSPAMAHQLYLGGRPSAPPPPRIGKEDSEAGTPIRRATQLLPPSEASPGPGAG